MSAERHALVKEIFLAVREQPLADRAAFLAQRCEGDEDLEQEVRSLLRRLPTEEGNALEDDDARTSTRSKVHAPNFFHLHHLGVIAMLHEYCFATQYW